MDSSTLSATDGDRLDRALISIRRFSTAPRVVPDGAASVELSTLLVLEAVLEGPEVAGGEIAIGLIGDRLDVRPSTASRLVDRAVRSGVLSKSPSAISGRRTNLALTSEGENVARRARQFRAARLDALLADWSTVERAALTTMLERFADAVHGERRGGALRPGRAT